MPETRRAARERAALDAEVSEGTHKAEVLSLLARDPDVGYERREINTRTEVPQSSLGKVLQRLRKEGLIEKHGKHYFVSEGRVDEIRRLIWDEVQLSAAEQISDENTAPEKLDYRSTEELEDELPDDIDELNL